MQHDQSKLHEYVAQYTQPSNYPTPSDWDRAFEQIEVASVGTSASYALKARRSVRHWRHLHNSHCLTVIHQGTSTWHHRGRIISVAGPALLIAQPGELQMCIRVETPATLTMLFLELEPLFEPRGALPRSAGVMPSIVGAREAMMLASRLLEEENPTQQEHRLLELIALLGPCPSVSDGPRQRVTPPVRRAKQLLHASYEASPATPPSLSRLAQQLGFSYYHLLHLFAREVGVPPYQYVKALRRAHAQRLLATSARSAQTSLMTVALTAGYSDAPHMNRDFKRSFGITPGRWRKGLSRSKQL